MYGGRGDGRGWEDGKGMDGGNVFFRPGCGLVLILVQEDQTPISSPTQNKNPTPPHPSPSFLTCSKTPYAIHRLHKKRENCIPILLYQLDR